MNINTNEEGSLADGFEDVLENDPQSLEWRDKCEYHFGELVNAHAKGIVRMRELMFVHSKGELGGNGTPDDKLGEREIPLMVRGISEDFRGELACRLMDILDPGWEEKAKELLMMAKIQQLLQGLDPSGSMKTH